MIEQKRLVVFVSKEDYKRLKAKLAMLETTVADWLRNLIKKFIQDDPFSA